MKKKLLSILIIFSVFCSLFSSTALAADEIHEPYIVDGVLYVPCPVGPGPCRMNLNGVGYVYVEDNGYTYELLDRCFVYQCPQCYNAVLCDIDAGFGYLGTYVMFNPGYQLNYWGTSITVTPEWVGYNSSIDGTYYLEDCIWQTY